MNSQRPTTPQGAVQVLNANGHDAVIQGGKVMSRKAGSNGPRQDVTRETLGHNGSGYEQSVRNQMGGVAGKETR